MQKCTAPSNAVLFVARRTVNRAAQSSVAADVWSQPYESTRKMTMDMLPEMLTEAPWQDTGGGAPTLSCNDVFAARLARAMCREDPKRGLLGFDLSLHTGVPAGANPVHSAQGASSRHTLALEFGRRSLPTVALPGLSQRCQAAPPAKKKGGPPATPAAARCMVPFAQRRPRGEAETYSLAMASKPASGLRPSNS